MVPHMRQIQTLGGEVISKKMSQIAAEHLLMSADKIDFLPARGRERTRPIGKETPHERIELRKRRELRRRPRGRGELADHVVVHSAEQLACLLEQQRIAIGAAGKSETEWIEEGKLENREITSGFSREQSAKCPLLRLTNELKTAAPLRRQSAHDAAHSLRIGIPTRTVGDDDVDIAFIAPRILDKTAHGTLQES